MKTEINLAVKQASGKSVFLETETNPVAEDAYTETVILETEVKPAEKKTSLKTKLLASLIALVIMSAFAFAAHILLTRQRTISTGNARVTTDLIYITAMAPGVLERFNVYSGMRVDAGKMIGWLRRGESFRSPIDGIIVSTHVVVDQHIRPMEPLAVIACLNNLHIQANFYESDIQDIRLGQPVAVTLDGVRGRTFAGRVRYIRRITELELAGGPIMVQTGTFRRITHTIPVEITVTDDVDLSVFLGTNARVSLSVIAGE